MWNSLPDEFRQLNNFNQSKTIIQIGMVEIASVPLQVAAPLDCKLHAMCLLCYIVLSRISSFSIANRLCMIYQRKDYLS